MPETHAGKESVAVLGAGIVGACCALALRREGYDVVLIDRDEPGRGASFGNAGMIQTGTPLPMATPGLLRAVPKMLFDPDGALVVRWRYLPRLAPWFLRFLRAAGSRRVEEISRAMASLLDETGPAYRELLKEIGATDVMRFRGILFTYRDDAEMKSSDWEFDLYRRRGVRFDKLQDDELWQMEPAINRDYRRGYYLPDTFFTVNPLRLTESVVREFTSLGGRFEKHDIRDVQTAEGGKIQLATANGAIESDNLVLAAGAFSKPFARRFGCNIPLETGRGYHLMLRKPGIELQGPVVDGVRHFGVVPMEEGIRLAGLMELASLEAPPDFQRADMLLPLARKMVPGLEDGEIDRWMGHRPVTPDSLPVLGKAPGHDNVVLAFGHGQLGLTMGALTGKLIAEIVAGRAPSVDLGPFRPDRF